MLAFMRASVPTSLLSARQLPRKGELLSQHKKDRAVPREKPSHILQFFSYLHLPKHLQEVSAGFYALADEMDCTLPDCAEKSAGLRKLLEAKDCMVRAAIEKQKG